MFFLQLLLIHWIYVVLYCSCVVLLLSRKASKTANIKASMSINDSRRSQESLVLQKSSSAPAGLASWYMFGWLVPALVSAVAAAIQWNDQRSPYTLLVRRSHFFKSYISQLLVIILTWRHHSLYEYWGNAHRHNWKGPGGGGHNNVLHEESFIHFTVDIKESKDL